MSRRVEDLITRLFLASSEQSRRSGRSGDRASKVALAESKEQRSTSGRLSCISNRVERSGWPVNWGRGGGSDAFLPEAFYTFAFREGGHAAGHNHLLEVAARVEHPVHPHACVHGIAGEDLQGEAVSECVASAAF